MFCPVCDRRVESTHRFCGGCGASLAGVTDNTPPAARSLRGQAAEADDVEGGEGLEAPDTTTVDAQLPAPAPALPDLGERPTRPIEIRAELPEPRWASTQAIVADELVDDVTADGDLSDARADEPVGADHRFGSTTGVHVIQPESQPVPAPSPVATPPSYTQRMPAVEPAPPLFDGATDVRELPLGREPFTLKLVFLLAFFGGVAAVMASAATMIDLRTSRPVDGISTGARLLEDLGSNLAVAGFVGAAVMVVGAVLSCFGFRWGGGLAGGAGLATAGWSAVSIGLAEALISEAETTTRVSPLPFTLKVTRDLGFWLVLAAGAIGVLAFLASLRSIRSGGHPPHNPWVAAVGAVAGVVLVAGPLLPVGREATFADNFSTSNLLFEAPAVYFVGRLVQLGLVLFCVVVGLLIVRAYGLGVAAGGISVAAWMWLSSLLDTTDLPPGPMGIAVGNFGASDTTPHAVTTVGVVLTVSMLLIAAVLASAGHFRHRRRRT